uniref:Formin like 2 n=1 Tax=Chrysemys picta bellii TaxID=8478 RepID=A0A8C3ITV1_CHRPI
GGSSVGGRSSPADIALSPHEVNLSHLFSLSPQNAMNLPPDKARLLRQYDNEKKWELICDQERFQVKNPPHTYIQKLKGYLDPAVTRKVRSILRRVQESTQVLRELEISLRTNHIGWVREFLNEENKGLDVLVEYLSFAQYAVTFDFESLENNVENSMDKSKPWSRSIEDLHRGSNLPSYNTLPSRRTLKNSRLVSKKDDVHVCIMCLRAIMNYQVCGEKQRFEKLMEHFRNEDNNIDFMVACMQFINIVVHSVEDMNFRVHLQYEFTKLGLDEYLDKLKHTESDKLQVQIQAYLDNVFDVGALLEDAETKNAALERVEELEENISHLSEKLQDTENEAMAKIVELEKQLMQRNKELDVVRVSVMMTLQTDVTFRRKILPPVLKCHLQKTMSGLLQMFPNSSTFVISFSLMSLAVKIKKPIKTKFRMPVFNWVALKPNQINGTVFNEIDDERILEDLNVDEFEEIFKTKAQGPAIDLTSSKQKITQKGSNKVTLLEANRAKNLAITLRKAGKTADEICKAIQVFDLKTLPVDFVECLMRFLPTENEVKVLRLYERERKPLENLTDEDRFMMQFSKIERLMQKMTIMAFIGNFAESIQMLTPQLHAVIAASVSIKSSQKLKKILEIILALGNYMNSSKRGAVYGFKLQSLDLLLDTKSTDRKQTLLHYISNVVKEKYHQVSLFYNELHYVEKAAAVSLENVLLDVKELQRGLDLTKREYTMHDHNTMLKEFIHNNEGKLKKLQDDAKIAQDAFDDAVKYFGENPKTTPPSVFFPVFVRFVKAYKKRKRGMQQCPVGGHSLLIFTPISFQSPSHKTKRQQQELIAELRRRQVKDNRHVYEGKDGAIEDIITVLKTVPFTARTAKRGSRFFCEPVLTEEFHY